MIFLTNNKDTCELCGIKCNETYWIEILQENGEKKDLFVCADCYFKIKKG